MFSLHFWALVRILTRTFTFFLPFFWLLSFFCLFLHRQRFRGAGRRSWLAQRQFRKGRPRSADANRNKQKNQTQNRFLFFFKSVNHVMSVEYLSSPASPCLEFDQLRLKFSFLFFFLRLFVNLLWTFCKCNWGEITHDLLVQRSKHT